MSDRDLRRVPMNEDEIRGFNHALDCLETWARQMQDYCDVAALSAPGEHGHVQCMRTTPDAMKAARFMAKALHHNPPSVG